MQTITHGGNLSWTLDCKSKELDYKRGSQVARGKTRRASTKCILKPRLSAAFRPSRSFKKFLSPLDRRQCANKTAAFLQGDLNLERPALLSRLCPETRYPLISCVLGRIAGRFYARNVQNYWNRNINPQDGGSVRLSYRLRELSDSSSYL